VESDLSRVHSAVRTRSSCDFLQLNFACLGDELHVNLEEDSAQSCLVAFFLKVFICLEQLGHVALAIECDLFATMAVENRKKVHIRTDIHHCNVGVFILLPPSLHGRSAPSKLHRINKQ